jgi:hypothetical protein
LLGFAGAFAGAFGGVDGVEAPGDDESDAGALVVPAPSEAAGLASLSVLDPSDPLVAGDPSPPPSFFEPPDRLSVL